jgi:hypothetical protein
MKKFFIFRAEKDFYDYDTDRVGYRLIKSGNEFSYWGEPLDIHRIFVENGTLSLVTQANHKNYRSIDD